MGNASVARGPALGGARVNRESAGQSPLAEVQPLEREAKLATGHGTRSGEGDEEIWGPTAPRDNRPPSRCRARRIHPGGRGGSPLPGVALSL